MSGLQTFGSVAVRGHLGRTATAQGLAGAEESLSTARALCAGGAKGNLSIGRRPVHIATKEAILGIIWHYLAARASCPSS